LYTGGRTGICSVCSITGSATASCTVDTENIPSVEEVTDLGITLHKSLKFSSHISVICCRAHRRANLIHKCFYSKDVSSLLSAFTTYARPILEYCCVVWNSLLVKDNNALEAVQRRFTQRIPGMKNLTYYQRLRALGIKSLELRRLRADLLFTYKFVFGLLDMNVSEFFITQFSNERRGHRYKLYVSTCKSSVRYKCFSHRVIRVWNILPDCVKFTSYSDFKHSLTTSVLIKFCKLFLCDAYGCSSVNVSQCTGFLYCNVSGLMFLL